MQHHIFDELERIMNQLPVQCYRVLGRCTASPSAFHIPNFYVRKFQMVITQRAKCQCGNVQKHIPAQLIEKLPDDLFRVCLLSALYIQSVLVIAYVIVLPRCLADFQRISKQYDMLVVDHGFLTSLLHGFLMLHNPGNLAGNKIVDFIHRHKRIRTDHDLSLGRDPHVDIFYLFCNQCIGNRIFSTLNNLFIYIHLTTTPISSAHLIISYLIKKINSFLVRNSGIFYNG